MMRCTNCGHDNPPGSLFCLNCGSQLAAAMAATPPAPAGLPVRCGTCGGENPPGMRFCRQCGTTLVQAAAAAPVYPAPVGMQPLMAPPMTPQSATGPAMGAPMPIPAAAQGFSPQSVGGVVPCPRCSSATPRGMPFCQQCGFQLPPDPQAATLAAPRQPIAAPQAVSAPVAMAPAPMLALVPPLQPTPPVVAPIAPPIAAIVQANAAAWGTAIAVNRDGSDGERFPLTAEFVHVGRAGADIAFDQDRFLARLHARLEYSGGHVRVVPLDTFNGVFRKIDAPVELAPGAIILVGREVLRFETVEGDERVAQPLVRHGVALFGSPPREPWGRLMQLLPSGGVRDVRHLATDEVTLGREDGDIVYRDDQFMSRRHAQLSWDGRAVTLTDLGSSNGTFRRLAGPEPLRNGDQLRMGDQLFRFDLRA